MHVCHLSSVHRSDDVRIFQKQCRSLVEHKFDVTFIVPDDNDRVEYGVKIIAIKRDMSKFARLFVQPLRILQKALQVRADIYQFHDYELWPIGVALKLLGKKVIVDVHEDVPAQLMQRTWVPQWLKRPLSFCARMFENTLARCMSGVVTADEVLANRFSALNRHVVTVPNYPVLVSLPEASTPSTFVVKSLGGVFNERCAHTIIDAAPLVPAAKFEVGGGIASAYVDLAWQTDNCTYLGRVPHEEIYQQYVDSSVLVVMFNDAPNHQDIKSNRLFESMYAGKPIVTSNLPKWRDFMEKYKCGLVVDPESSDELAQAIQFLAEHPDEAMVMGERGRAAVHKEFSWNPQVPRLIELYKQVNTK